MYWKSALIQHPMYLVIREDATCAERTPPWGEPTIELYIERVRRTLHRLRDYPKLKIGFEWSGVELELLARDAPDVFSEMCELAHEGRVAFYNGTYSQPHLQVQSAEANVRQFEYGAQVYRELCNYDVQTYAHQETSIHDQLPQLLRAFNIRYGALPQFPSTLRWLDNGEIILRLGEPHFVHGREFVWWMGLDWTQVPLYLTPHRHPVAEWITRETMAGLMHGPRILLQNRDLFEVNAEWLAARAGAEMVLLDQAFAEQLAQSPPRGHARHFTYWSYIEGIRAEELSRANWIAETRALQAEALDAMAFALLGRPAASTDALWKTILTCQHHDAYCFCAPGLRDKAIGWLREATGTAQAMIDDAAQVLAARVDTTAQQGLPLVVFNTVPHARHAFATVHVPPGYSRLTDSQGNLLPVQVITAGDSSSLKFLARSQGLGYETYWLAKAAAIVQETQTDAPFTFENAFYRATIQPDGTFSSLLVKPSNAELLAQTAPAGNFLSATDSTGISPQLDPGLTGKPLWEIPPAPDEFRWHVDSPMHLRTTPLGTTVSVNARLGEQVSVALTIDLYHDFPRIDLTYDFDFKDASIGIFYLDETKLRVGWRLVYDGEIWHDIPFGVVQTEPACPILPTSWIDISDGVKGLAFFHQGTFKHWVQDRTVVNLLAWGEATNAIGDRMWRENWAKSFDQRLRGRHTIHTALYPHMGNWREANVVPMAHSYNHPMLGYVAAQHAGTLPSSVRLLNIFEPEFRVTSVRAHDAQIACRLYSFAERGLPLIADTNGVQVKSWQTLRGEAISQLDPFQISHLMLERVQARF